MLSYLLVIIVVESRAWTYVRTIQLRKNDFELCCAACVCFFVVKERMKKKRGEREGTGEEKKEPRSSCFFSPLDLDS